MLLYDFYGFWKVKNLFELYLYELYSHFHVTKHFLTDSPIIKFTTSKVLTEFLLGRHHFFLNEEEGVQIHHHN